jgi:FKBP-type peptidyl-prolyl cis-trans isomerase SlyD
MTAQNMTVQKNRVVTIDYTLTGEDGAVLDTSSGQEPLSYIQGSGSIINGLETALEGRSPRDQLTVSVAPQDAYGVRDESFVIPLPRKQFREVEDLEIGMQFHLQGGDTERVVTVVGINDKEVIVDANHPFAGMTLRFEVTIVGVREATGEELAHGHVHDDGGHGHHEGHGHGGEHVH